jgi:hypothetical protein
MSQFKPVVVNAAAVKSRPVQWLWDQVVPRGKLTILCGDPGLGKSFITLDLAARTSRGGPWPFTPGAKPARPMRAILLSAEDDPADTIRPRLEAMGADLSKVEIVDSMVDRYDRVTDFVIGEHSRDLAGLLEEGGDVGLLVVDPVSAYVGGTDSYNNAQVRSMLKPLSDLAADHDVAVVLVTHLRKAEAAKALHAAMGSLAFTAAARVVLLTSRDRADPQARLLLTVKSNLADDRRGFRYKVENGRVAWIAAVEGQADEILRTGRPGPSSCPQASDFASALREALAKGPKPVPEIMELARACGVPWNHAQRSGFKSSLGIGTRKTKDAWEWFLLPPKPEARPPHQTRAA